MRKVCVSYLLALVLGTLQASSAPGAPVPAFPGAEGPGAYATGGRGGAVYHVTNLNPNGPGSLAEAVSQPNRIVVFDVSGTIDLLQEKQPGGKEKNPQSLEEAQKEILEKAAQSGYDKKWIEKKTERAQIKEDKRKQESMSATPTITGGKILIGQPNITIAGQTAPGEGICIIHGSLTVNASNVIIRHIRVRRGHIAEGVMGDGVTVKGEDKRLENIMLDHISSCWATDENLTVTADVTNATAQYCIASEGMDYFDPEQTPPRHSEGSLFGSTVPDGCVAFHHLIYAHNRLRNPRITGGDRDRPAVHEFRNSIVYDWIEHATHTGSGSAKVNWINNYYRPGASTREERRDVIFHFGNKHGPISMYASGNALEGHPEYAKDSWLGVRYGDSFSPEWVKDENSENDNRVFRVDEPFPAPSIATQDVAEAYETCLAQAGATLPSRDPIDLRIVNDIRHGSGRVIEKETDLPEQMRWPQYWSLPAPADSDEDGMPDYWEAQYGFDPGANDAMADRDGDGYLNIEEYLNGTDPKGTQTPIVWVSAPVSRANKYDEFPGQLKVSRSGAAAGDLIVKYSVSGTAKSAEDYVPLPGEIKIPAGQSSAIVLVEPLLKGKSDMGQRARQEDASVVLTIAKTKDYNVGCPQSAMIVIQEH